MGRVLHELFLPARSVNDRPISIVTEVWTSADLRRLFPAAKRSADREQNPATHDRACEPECLFTFADRSLLETIVLRSAEVQTSVTILIVDRYRPGRQE